MVESRSLMQEEIIIATAPYGDAEIITVPAPYEDEVGYPNEFPCAKGCIWTCKIYCQCICKHH